MKKSSIRIIFLVLSLVLFSCGTMPCNYSVSQSWHIPKNDSKKIKSSLTILDVQVDRLGGWDSVERETAVLAPLYFWDCGYRVVTPEEEPVFAAAIQVREREFNIGWRTKRSLAVEVRIWPCEDASSGGLTAQCQKLPAVVGRVAAVGDKTFLSSQTTGRMLSRAIKKAARKLTVYIKTEKNA
jgi:hypothetical protein